MRRKGIRGFGLAAMLALAVVASACSSGSTPSGSGTTQPPSPSAGQSTDSGGGAGGPTTASVQAGAGGFVFSPTAVTIAEGGVVTVKNVGTIHHTFTIQTKNINQVLNPGDSAKITIDLPPGTYPFVCTFHQSQGMTGTLTVTD
jgi:plastocyanin